MSSKNLFKQFQQYRELDQVSDTTNIPLSNENSLIQQITDDISGIENWIKEIERMQNKNLINRFNNDDVKDKKEINDLATRILDSIKQTKGNILLIKQLSGNSHQRKINVNLEKGFAQELQNLVVQFRQNQNKYKQKYDQQQEQFEIEESKSQLLEVQDNILIEERNHEIKQIADNISDLTELFKDLATLVVDQGTILDSIEDHINQSQAHIEDGVHELHEGAKTKKCTYQCYCILILTILVIVVLIILAFTLQFNLN